ncbi:enoyl-CoA hydratase-related protein [Nocardioides sp. NPDC057577]|uniref:enoyl-CoA hydratase-related protein n=1 Tax=Nocardioides sp. NPDC057577 TaxID=3346171 RepID=UPI00366AE269
MTPVSCSVSGGFARVCLQDIQRGNPIDQAMVDGLAEAVREIREADVAVVVLESAAAAFSVGGDLHAFAAAEAPDRLIDDLAESLHRVVSELHRLDAIVVAVVRGVAAGAGLSLAAAADLIIAARSARFVMAYTGVGLTPDGGGALLHASLGLHRALGLALLNPTLTADEAHQGGLVTQVHPDEEMDAAVDKVVCSLTSGSRAALVSTKRLIRDSAMPGAEATLRSETASIRSRAGSPDGREGVRAFIEKRVPIFPENPVGAGHAR